MSTFCDYYNKGICSSCSRIEISYSQQIDLKEAKLKQILEPFTPYDHKRPILSHPTRFRNKAKFSVTGTIDRPVIGLTGETELDEGREITQCELHYAEINEILTIIPEFLKLTNLKPYQIKQKTGELKGLIIYFSSESKEMYLRFILRSKESLDRLKKHTPFIQSHFPQLKCFSANIQPIPHAILEGEEEIFFTSRDHIEHKILNVHMTLHPQGFVQTNQAVAGQLYSTAASWIKELNPKKFMELFSGQGAFSFFIQEFVEEALGIEINPEAVSRANENAKKNGWNHLKFLSLDAGDGADQIKDFSPDILLVNPPRRGLGRAMELVKNSSIEHFIYSSCNAETLAKDLHDLRDKFKVRRVQLFDMFPNTDHFETLVLLEAVNVD